MSKYTGNSGPWTELKHKVLDRCIKDFRYWVRDLGLHSIYIDGFAGAGEYDGKPGSPLIAYGNGTNFHQHILIESHKKICRSLREIFAAKKHVQVIQGDCNIVVERQVISKLKELSSANFCFLDPCGLQLAHKTVKTLLGTQLYSLLINFPTNAADRSRGKKRHPALDKMLGCENIAKRSEDLSVLYAKKLESEGAPYVVVSTTSVNIKNSPQYCLIHVSTDSQLSDKAAISFEELYGGVIYESY